MAAPTSTGVCGAVIGTGVTGPGVTPGGGPVGTNYLATASNVAIVTASGKEIIT